MDEDVIRLPESLSRCACPNKPRHLVTCPMAIALDALPLTQRPEYQLGARFEAIRWDWPMTMTGSYRIQLTMEPESIIRHHREQYEAFQVDSGYEEWEKPMLFIGRLIEEQIDFGGFSFGHRRFGMDTSYLDELEEYPRWTKENTEDLDRRLAGTLVHPDQGVLFS